MGFRYATPTILRWTTAARLVLNHDVQRLANQHGEINALYHISGALGRIIGAMIDIGSAASVYSGIGLGVRRRKYRKNASRLWSSLGICV
ncbi:hypothetical protein BASA60_000982 [Batrachochytrium salamandrivorans]|nr:hypothetical protein BASA60_000982 [Batrachochytrium salamandrivorans]